MSNSQQSDVMNFLNEVSSRFPQAISLAAGRPTEAFFDRLGPQVLQEAMTRYERHLAHDRGDAIARSLLLQYGRTAGIIDDLIAAQLRVDYGVPASADRTLVTAGFQEAMALALPVLCPEPEDVLLVCNPTYTGAIGVADMHRIAVHGLSQGDVAQAINQAVVQLQREGRHPRALYLIPDFDNPTGRVLDRSQRRDVLKACEHHRIVILEDNPYGMFRYEGEPVPSLAELDEAGCVVFLSTFSKTLCPAMRMGAVVLPETLFGERAAQQALWQALVQRKSYITLNTSPLTQAMAGGMLLAMDGSLKRWVEPMAAWYRDNLDVLTETLGQVFEPHLDRIRWNRPEGGFFLTLELPFDFDAQAVTDCATDYGVIVMPMAFFALDDSQNRRVRLAFSAMNPDQIRAGAQALGRYVVRRLALQ